MSFTLDLDKAVQDITLNLDKNGVDLSHIPKLQVRLAIDKSGSMADLYDNGYVSHVVDMMIAAGMLFDDNGELEFGVFDENFRVLKSVTKSGLGTFDSMRIPTSGGTAFTTILEKFWVGERIESEKQKLPNFVQKIVKFFNRNEPYSPNYEKKAFLVVITDGMPTYPSDLVKFENLLKELEPSTFLYIIGIGKDVESNTLKGIAKSHENVDTVHYKDPTKVSDETFYEDLVGEKFSNWLKG